MGITNKSYRRAVYPEQGMAFIENTGTDWLRPEAQVSSIEIFDDDGQPHTLVEDYRDGFLYDISTRDGPEDSGMTQAKKDKIATDGTGGTDISANIKTREMRGTFEKFFQLFKIFHIYMRPEKESDGFPAGLEVDLDIYKDGEQTTPSATAKNIPRTGDVAFDRAVEAHRLQLKMTTNKSEQLIVGWQADNVAEDRPADPDDLVMTEDDWQEEFALPDVWAAMNNGTLINRASGNEITGSYVATTGPDSETDLGFTITGAFTLPSTTLTGAGVLLIWHNAAISVTIGGVAVVLVEQGTVGGWTLSYANTLTESGAIVVTPTGATADISDVRTYNSAISDNARGYYYTDISSNKGGIVV